MILRHRRDAGVVELAALERQCIRKGTVGSNPTLSAQMYHAYILRSIKDGSYYYGSAEDISKRLNLHNRGKVRYTKGHIPYQLHYCEEFSTRTDAIQREKFFKSIAGYRWLRNQGIIK